VTTDGVFRGDKPFSTENDQPQPRTKYGWSKLHGEQEVIAATANHLIVRTNFYGWSSGRKKTSAEWLYRALSAGEPIVGFADFFFTPIYVVDFVDRLLQLIASPHRGLFHLCGAERVSKYDFAMQLAREGGLSSAAITKGSIDQATLVAPRPKDMSLSTARFCQALSTTVPDCGAGIRRFLGHRGIPLADRFVDVVKTAGGPRA
jgi:dTDP-4-dehydrorhamnose reductase